MENPHNCIEIRITEFEAVWNNFKLFQTAFLFSKVFVGNLILLQKEAFLYFGYFFKVVYNDTGKIKGL